GKANANLITATNERGKAEFQLKQTQIAKDQSLQRLFEARLAQAKAGSLSRRVGQRLDSLDALTEATKIARQLTLTQDHLLLLRNAAIACLALPDLRLSKQWPGWGEGTQWVEFDHELEHYARGDIQGAISVRRTADDQEVVR